MLATRCDNIHLRNNNRLGAYKQNENSDEEASKWHINFNRHVNTRIETLNEQLNKSVTI
jgi:hypothetical protein